MLFARGLSVCADGHYLQPLSLLRLEWNTRTNNSAVFNKYLTLAVWARRRSFERSTNAGSKTCFRMIVVNPVALAFFRLKSAQAAGADGATTDRQFLKP